MSKKLYCSNWTCRSFPKKHAKLKDNKPHCPNCNNVMILARERNGKRLLYGEQ